MITRRMKDMLGLYQNILAGVISAVVGSSDATVVREGENKGNMCIDTSLEQKVEQCKISDTDWRGDMKGSKKKQQYAALQQILKTGSMIVSEGVLEAVISVESGGNVEIGSRGNGCGVMQLTLPAIAGGLSRLYSPNGRNTEFKVKYEGSLDKKRVLIDLLTDNYFTILGEGAKRSAERVKEIQREYMMLKNQKKVFKDDRELSDEVALRMKQLREEREILGQFASAVKHGYILFDPGAQKVYAQKIAYLRKAKDADKYITWAAGMNILWVDSVSKQRQMIKEVRRKACDMENTMLNVTFGDLTLAMEGEYFNGKKGRKVSPIQQALFSYNQGRTDYLTNGAKMDGEYYQRFAGAYYTLFDKKPPRVVPLRESRRIM